MIVIRIPECSVLYLKHCVWFWASHFEKDIEVPQQVWRGTMRLVGGLEGKGL